MQSKRKRGGTRKPQSPSTTVVAHSSPPASPYCDGGFNVVNDTHQIAALISLCFPISLQANFEAQVVQHLDSLFSCIGKPSFGEISPIFSCLLSGYNDCRSANPSILPNWLRLASCCESDITKSLHDAFLIDCTLSRTTKKSRVKRESVFTETDIRTRVSAALADRSNDHFFRTLILYFPYAGCFFTIARQLHATSTAQDPPPSRIYPLTVLVVAVALLEWQTCSGIVYFRHSPDLDYGLDNPHKS